MAGGPSGPPIRGLPFTAHLCVRSITDPALPANEEEHQDVQCHAADGDAAATSIGSVN